MSDDHARLMAGDRIVIHFNVHQPIELVELTYALQGFGMEYQSHVRELTASIEPKNIDDVKLYITKIENNCILAELAPAIPMLGAIVPILADLNTVGSFVQHVADAVKWLRSIRKKKNLSAEHVPYGKRQLKNVDQVLRLVGSKPNAALGLKAIKVEERSGLDYAAIEVSFDTKECREASEGVGVALRALESTERADHEKVLMYFYQTNTDDPKSFGRTGDMAVIASLWRSPLRLYIINDLDQQKIRHVLDDRSRNPLHTGFVVDVNVERDPRGQPKFYRVMRIHDVIPGDSEVLPLPE